MKLKTLKQHLDNYFIFGDSEKSVIVKNDFQKNRFKILNVEKDFDDTIYIIISRNEKWHGCRLCGYEKTLKKGHETRLKNLHFPQ